MAPFIVRIKFSLNMQVKPIGYFGIGVENLKTGMNLGTLWRSAYLFGASFIFTTGARYRLQASDTEKTYRHIPLLHYSNFDDFYENMPHDCMLIGVELSSEATPIAKFAHPDRCIYLLGAEDNGLTKRAMERVHQVVILPGDRSMNVAVAGSIMMFDRVNKNQGYADERSVATGA